MARTIRYDDRSLWLGDRRLQLVSGAFHYFRVPRSEWEDRLGKSWHGGLNTIETIVPWNVHEYREGRFDFAGNRDLDAFLTLCADLGFHVMVRPSPYICGEWDAGGLPSWLPLKAGVAFRRGNPVYLSHVARWYDELMPLLARHQWTRGGPVILAQIENEYGYFQDAQDLSYIEFLRDAMTARGIEVPLTTCDWPGRGFVVPGTLKCGNCGSGFREAVAALRREQPDAFPFISELWLAWFDAWHGGHHMRPAGDVAMALREVLAAGGHYNFYMWAGGTNHGYFAGRTTGGPYGAFITTSYDYDAPIGETGNLTAKFYECRLVNWLARSLPELFAGAAESACPWTPSSQDVSVTERSSPAGAVVSVRNVTERAGAVHLLRSGGEGGRFPQSFDLPLTAGQTLLLLRDCRLTARTVVAACSAEVLAWVDGPQPALLVYGAAGEPCELRVAVDGAAPAEWILAYPQDGDAAVHRIGDVDFVLLARETARVTWIEGDQGERRWRIDPGYGVRRAPVDLPRLRWEEADPVAHLGQRAAQTSPTPRPLEEFGIHQGYGWYRTTFDHVGGPCELVLTDVHDRATVLLNGECQGVIGSFASFARLPVRARPGRNEVLVLLDALGRYTFTARLGETKGLSGAAYIGGRTAELAPWRAAGAPGAETPDTRRYEIPIPWRPGEGLLVRIWGLSNRPATLGLDGQALHRHRSIGDDDEWVELDLTPHLRPGGNTLWLQAGGEGGDLPQVAAVRFHVLGQLPGPWRVYGGVVGEDSDIDAGEGAFATLGWRPRETGGVRPQASRPMGGRPALYRATFHLDLPADAVPLQLLPAGLGKGVAWLNGHHLGRYWNVGPQTALVVPHEWFRTENTLILFDEEGRAPDAVRWVQHEGVIHASLP